MSLEENQCSVGVQVDKDVYVGYGTFGLNIIMIIISLLGIGINSIFSYNYLKQMLVAKNKKGKKDISAVEKILCMVAIVETIISFCWLINNLFMNNTHNMYEHCGVCSAIAHIEIFFYLFDWMILSTSLYQVRILILNPEQLLESGRRVFKYVIICFISALSSLIFSIASKIGGVSPLLTCFINIQILEKPIQHCFFWIFFCIPLFTLLFGISQVFLIMRSSEYKLEKNNRIFFIFCYYLYCFFFNANYYLYY